MKLFALGNALVDDEAVVDEAFLSDLGLTKGHMKLIEEAELLAYRSRIEPLKRSGGGSAANSCAAYAGFGGEAYFCGRVAADEVGEWFIKDVERYGVDAPRPQAFDGGISGQCMVLITPDAQRTMLTFLGVAASLRQEDVDESALAQADITYVEGYMASNSESIQTCVAAAEIARFAGREIAVSLSDSSMVRHFRSGLDQMLAGGVTHVFCNLEEALLFADTDRLDIAVTRLREVARVLHITLGAQGSLCVRDGIHAQAGAPETKAVDTTGAGDMYAGAALYAHAQGADCQAIVSFANLAASHIVSLYGARLSGPDDYAELRKSLE